jgi:hypothetical protein
MCMVISVTPHVNALMGFLGEVPMPYSLATATRNCNMWVEGDFLWLGMCQDKPSVRVIMVKGAGACASDLSYRGMCKLSCLALHTHPGV